MPMNTMNTDQAKSWFFFSYEEPFSIIIYYLQIRYGHVSHKFEIRSPMSILSKFHLIIMQNSLKHRPSRAPLQLIEMQINYKLFCCSAYKLYCRQFYNGSNGIEMTSHLNHYFNTKVVLLCYETHQILMT